MAFDVKKAAQVVAFLVREQGDNANHITTVKLVYMADRSFLERYDVPILDDELVSMEYGPVDSQTYDYIKGAGKDRKVWEQYILPRKDNVVRLARKLTDVDFDELSLSEVVVLREVWAKFKGLKPFELVDHIHERCPEWEDVGKTSKPLPYERVFNVLGKKNSNELTDRIYELRNIQVSIAEAK